MIFFKPSSPGRIAMGQEGFDDGPEAVILHLPGVKRQTLGLNMIYIAKIGITMVTNPKFWFQQHHVGVLWELPNQMVY